MTVYDAQPVSVPATSKTWEATVTYRECGVVTAICTYTVSMERVSPTEIIATVDGVIVDDIRRATRILSSAQDDNGLRLISETRPFPPSMARALGVTL